MNAVLGTILAAIGGVLVYTSYVLDGYPLSTESPLASLYIYGATSGSWEAGLFLLVFALGFYGMYIPSFKQSVHSTTTHIKTGFSTLPNYGQSIVVFSLCLGFLIALNASGIINGYFHSDDFQILTENNSHTLLELFFLPYNDHLIPLYRMEVAVLYELFGINPIPYNIFFLLIEAAIPLALYLLLRALKFPVSTFLIFLPLYIGSVLMGEFLSGFYMVSMYPQIILFSLLMLLSYVKWSEEAHGQKRILYLALSLMSLSAALFIDIAGVWVAAAFVVFSYFHFGARANSWSIHAYLHSNKTVLAGILAVTAIFGTYATFVLIKHPENLLLGGESPTIFNLMGNLYDVITAGVIAQILAPSAGLVLSQPRFIPLLPLWEIFMILCLVGFSIAVYLVTRSEDNYTRRYIYSFVLIFLGVSILPAIGRPSGHIAAFFPVQQIIMSFFWYAILLSIVLSGYTKQRPDKRLGLVVALCVLIMGWQHVFGFYNDDNVAQVKDSRLSVEKLETIVPALNKLAIQETSSLTVPDLIGAYINPYVPGNDMWKYRAFLEFNPKIFFLNTRNGPYRASTSPEFIKELSRDGIISSLYLSHIELEETYQTKPLEKWLTPLLFESDGSYYLKLRPTTLSPQKEYVLSLDLSVPTKIEKVLVGITFQNDFSATGTIATIRLDQFSKSIASNSDRRFVIDVDLNQMYVFALSKEISDLELVFQTPGKYTLYGYRFGNKLNP